jgi:hypothetical protein
MSIDLPIIYLQKTIFKGALNPRACNALFQGSEALRYSF